MEHAEYSSPEQELNEKTGNIEALTEGKPDALYLLSGISEITDKNTGETAYKPGSYSDVDWNGLMTGGKARALAITELSEHFPEATVAANSSTFNLRNSEAPSDAEVMAQYLEKKGVNPDRIIQQERSTTTFTELIELFKYIAEHQWKHVVVMAGETQKPRTIEMIRQIATLQDPAGAWKDEQFRSALAAVEQLRPKIVVLTPEDVLPLRDPRYEQLISQAKETDVWKKRAALDAKAVDDLQNGLYWKTP